MVKKNIQLDPDEKILLRSQKHHAAIYVAISYLLFVLLYAFNNNDFVWIFFLTAYGLILLVASIHIYMYREYVLTNQRLLVVSGYYYLRNESIPIDKIEHVTLNQSLLHKWLGIGTLTLFGIGIRTKKINGLQNAKDFRDAIHSQLPVDPEPYFSN